MRNLIIIIVGYFVFCKNKTNEPVKKSQAELDAETPYNQSDLQYTSTYQSPGILGIYQPHKPVVTQVKNIKLTEYIK